MPSPAIRNSELVEMYWQKCAKGLGTGAFNAIISVSYVYWQNIHLLNLTAEISPQFFFFLDCELIVDGSFSLLFYCFWLANCMYLICSEVDLSWFLKQTQSAESSNGFVRLSRHDPSVDFGNIASSLLGICIFCLALVKMRPTAYFYCIQLILNLINLTRLILFSNTTYSVKTFLISFNWNDKIHFSQNLWLPSTTFSSAQAL